MIGKARALALAFVCISSIPAAAAPPEMSEEKATRSSAPLVREERAVTVRGVEERWRLEWARPPEPVCPPDEEWMDGWGTCPCAGFEFAEAGELDLVRSRPGEPEDRLHLTSFFSGMETPGKGAVLPRWPVEKGDMDASGEPGFARRVRARPLVKVMSLADYDHDGNATEFVLQVGAGPCGHRQTVLVGVDARNPRLHAFGSAEKPGEPLTLEHRADWEKLRAGSGVVVLPQTPCGDHGSDRDVSVRLRADANGIHARWEVKKCPD